MSIRNTLTALAAAALALAVAGCATSSHSTAPADLGQASSSGALRAAAATAGPVKLTRIVAADWAVDRSGLINLDHPKAEAAGLEDGDEPIQIYFYVLEHPTRGTYIVDTGVAASFRDEETAPVSGIVASAMNFDELKVHVDTAQWLAERQTSHAGPRGAIAGVFLTHIHLDHIMGLPDVPADVPVYSGPGEAAASRFLNMFVQGTTDDLLAERGPLREWGFGPDPDGALDGVIDVFGDGSVFAIHAPGHTPGSSAYLVRTPEGPVLLVGDACHTEWGWANGVEPGSFNIDGDQAATSLGRLQALAASIPGLRIHLGHQPHGEPPSAAR